MRPSFLYYNYIIMIYTAIYLALTIHNQCQIVLSAPAAPMATTATIANQTIGAYILNYDKFDSMTDAAGYNFSYKTSDGISRKEVAVLKYAGTANESISVQGTVTWLGPDGIQYTLNYLADENGFQPVAKHLPIAPEATSRS